MELYPTYLNLSAISFDWGILKPKSIHFKLSVNFIFSKKSSLDIKIKLG